jgi:glutathione gamma-glutamylcysteinyltransferase
MMNHSTVVQCMTTVTQYAMSSRTRPLPKDTFYKRSLPDVCIAFDSSHGKRLFREAMDEGHMDSYFALSMQYLTQSEPAFCGLGSLCMVLNSFGIDPLRQWKGPWRWYDESMLNCCRTLDEIKIHGVHLDEFVCIAKCNRLKSRLFRPHDT